MLSSFLITKIVHVVFVSCSTSLVGFSKIVVPVITKYCSFFVPQAM